jgi:hypothetical protein
MEKEENILRIQQMEQHLDRASEAVMQLSAALDKYNEVQQAIKELSDYYGSEQWKSDFEADEAGLLPRDLRRGVLSEDAIWNLLEENRDLTERMKEI